VTGSQDSTTCLFSLDSGAFEKVLLRSTLPVNCAQFAPDGKWVAIASEESVIKLVNVDNISNVKVLNGHSSAVKSICFDPTGEYLISACCDESLRIWDIQDEKAECIKTLAKSIAPLDSDDPDPFTMSWSANGKYITVPGKKSDILMIQRGTWQIMGSFKNAHIKPILETVFSSDGKYFLSIGTDKRLCIWKMGKDGKVPLFKYVL
jgi:chromosome transmission fidelity protein 4